MSTADVYGHLERHTTRLRKRGDRIEPRADDGPWCQYRTERLRSVVRVAGLILRKYTRSSRRVFLRGQCCPCQQRMLPSIARPDLSHHSIGELIAALNDVRVQIKQALGQTRSRFQDDLLLAVLQHYGMRTHWLDAVDNLFVALWFASNGSSKDGFGRIYLLSAENEHVITDWETPKSKIIGGGKSTKWCDLRRQYTSLSLRPHAQHGVLLARVGGSDLPSSAHDLDLTSSVLAEIRFPLSSEIVQLMDEQTKDFYDWMFPAKSQDYTFACLAEPRVRSIIRDSIAKHLTNPKGDELGCIHRPTRKEMLRNCPPTI